MSYITEMKMNKPLYMGQSLYTHLPLEALGRSSLTGQTLASETRGEGHVNRYIPNKGCMVVIATLLGGYPRVYTLN